MRIKGKRPLNSVRVKAQECLEPQQSVANLFRSDVSIVCSWRRVTCQRSQKVTQKRHPCGQEASRVRQLPCQGLQHFRGKRTFSLQRICD